MIAATFVFGSALQYKGFTLSGHAEFADYGQDIACAGVSALALSIALALQEYLGWKAGVVQGETGLLRVEVAETECSDELLCRAETLLKTLQIGLENIARNYPGSVQISESEVFPDGSF